MKTKRILLLIFMMCGSKLMLAQYPIPSWSIDVCKQATFEEQSGLNESPAIILAKRMVDVHVTSKKASQSSYVAAVWIYSLDRTTIFGPYYMVDDETKQVEIDDRLWGVYVETDEEITVDVWIE
jgi:hypothetical protein